ncbi:MAG: LLM class flavin-dependent oxidoreductase [Candidatus Thorarchaeota archaeon]
MYRVSAGMTTNMQKSATDWIADNARELGLDGIWIGEDIGLGQDVFVLTAATIMQSKGVRVSNGIIPITVHNISTIARAAFTLYELGEGRYVFGTGIGGLQDLKRRDINVTKPVTELERGIQTLRRLWSGERASIDSHLFHLEGYSLGIDEQATIPVFMGVRGPQMLKLAGRIADGVIFSGPIEYLRAAFQIVNDSASKHGRDPKDVEKVVWLPTIVQEGRGTNQLAKRVVALVASDMPPFVLEMLDIDEEKLDQVIKTVAKEGPSAGAEYVQEEMLDTFAISGTPEQIVNQFDALGEMGATDIILGPPYSRGWRKRMKAVMDLIKERSGR